MMDESKIGQLTRDYTSALEDYLVKSNEAGLKAAYEIGRNAISEGLGVLDLIAAYKAALGSLLPQDPDERVTAEGCATTFLAESLSPFEMTHRSFREANMSLQKLNEALERRVKERTRELETANRELKDFAHIVSHDLKAPLSALQSISEVLASECGEKLDVDGRELLDMLGNCATRMQRLIDGILQYSKVGRTAETRSRVNLNRLVREVLEMLAPPPGIRIEVGILPEITCERVRIQQVFQNLLSNAVKFQDKPEGKIRVSAENRGRYWKFTIEDNGCGIPESHCDRIFQLFVSLNDGTNGASTGVGLAVVKKIVEMYGGKVRVRSQPGEGSAFSFTLPK